MPRYEERARGDRHNDRGGGGGGGYWGGDAYLSSHPDRGGFGGGGSGRGGDGPDAGATRLYAGRLSNRTRSRDLEDLFAKYGRYFWQKQLVRNTLLACLIVVFMVPWFFRIAYFSA